VHRDRAAHATGQAFTEVRCSDFGYLVWGDGCCDDALEDFLRRYLAVNPKTLLPALASAVLAVSMLGCGTNNHLQSINLGILSQDGQVVTNQGGVYNLVGDGSTLQLQATGNYSNGKSVVLGGSGLVYNVIVDPNYTLDANGNPILPPCQAPACPSPSAPPYTQGSVEYSPTGLITAVEPAVCTWVQQGTGWFFQGAYQVTATYKGVTSQPAYIPVASKAGPGLNGACGPTPE
jgi:hypothetical protein